jgi:hypothetical protein
MHHTHRPLRPQQPNNRHNLPTTTTTKGLKKQGVVHTRQKLRRDPQQVPTTRRTGTSGETIRNLRTDQNTAARTTGRRVSKENRWNNIDLVSEKDNLLRLSQRSTDDTRKWPNPKSKRCVKAFLSNNTKERRKQTQNSTTHKVRRQNLHRIWSGRNTTSTRTSQGGTKKAP